MITAVMCKVSVLPNVCNRFTILLDFQLQIHVLFGPFCLSPPPLEYMQADNVAVLQDGKVVEVGTYAELMVKEGGLLLNLMEGGGS